MKLVEREIRHAHLFCGLGGGAAGFNEGQARVGNSVAKFRCLGGIDVDATAIRNFERLAKVQGTVMDLFDYDQYVAFHGCQPEPGWQPAGVADIHRAFGNERPHIVFISAPCKGFSGLLAETTSRTAKYQALNGLTLRAVWLTLEAYKDDPPELFIFENVPRIMTRGRHLLDQIVALFRSYGYNVAETTHDCGEIGDLAQSRKRFLLVARHRGKVPNFLYEPVRHKLRGVGEVLDRLPLPGTEAAGAMHRVPQLQWKTWVRLAFVEAGKDWRSLNGLRVGDDGNLLDFAIMPDRTWNNGVLGVTPWDDSAGVVTSNGRPGSGSFAVADPRPPTKTEYQQYGVRRWTDTSGAVSSQSASGGGTYSVADPRLDGPARFNSTFLIVPFDAPSPAVAGPGGPAGGLSVADPRQAPRSDYKQTKYRVTAYDEAAGAVISASTTGNGAYCVADPRTGFGPNSHRNKLAVVGYDAAAGAVTGSDRVGSGALSVADPRPRCLTSPNRDGYSTQGHYGVVAWDEHTRAVPAFAKNNNGSWSVADPRDFSIAPLPVADQKLVCRITALDGTWHRPFTTMELAALQSLFDPELWHEFGLFARSDAEAREQIGNAVPRKSARAVAGVMGRTLLSAWAGETFCLSNEAIWVQPIALAAAVYDGAAA